MSDKQSRAPRYSVANLNVIYDADGSFWSGPVVDMSESGIFIETSHELPIGTAVTLVPDVSDDDALPFEIAAQVVRVVKYEPDQFVTRKPGLGFRIVGLRPEQMTQLSQFLRQRGVPVSGATLVGP